MCGINGFVGGEFGDLLKKMNDAVIHRGPDDHGEYHDTGIALGHRRLSILDLSERGRNPMFTDDQSACIVLNGEIYNFKDVRTELEKKGHRFKSETDTEAVLYAYKEWGEEFLSHLRGMFGLAIWDIEKKRLILARDRIGIKPLHYSIVGDTLLFASEQKSLLQYEKVNRAVHRQAVYNFLNINYTPGNDTFFAGIKRIPAGHMLIYDKSTGIKGIRFKKYWDIPVNIQQISDADAIKQLNLHLTRSISEHLMSDVPFGAYLSGGVDSSAIVGYMSRLVDEPIKTYSVGFDEPWDELGEARRIAEHFGCDHHELIVTSKDMRKHYAKAIWHMDAPQRNIIPSMLISKLAKKKVTVMQNGLGGDEIFAGYRRHKYLLRSERIGKILPKALREHVFANLSRIVPSSLEIKRGLRYLATSGEKEKNYIVIAPQVVYPEDLDKSVAGAMLHGLTPMEDVVRPYFRDDVDFFNQALIMEIKSYLTDDLLDRFDRLGMSASIEGRVPFLDHDLIEFAFTLESNLKLRNNQGKWLLKQTVKDMLPAGVINNKKQGFNMNNYHWFKGEFGDIAKQILVGSGTTRSGYFNKEYFTKILNRKMTPRYVWHYAHAWNAAAFEIWHKMYIEDAPEDLSKVSFDLGVYI